MCANKAVWPGHNDLATVNLELASEWHPTRNGTLRACDVTPKSGKTAWWLGKCGHEWSALISSRSNGNKCLACSNRCIWVGHNNLATINPQLAKEWHPTKNGTITASNVTPGSKRIVWWICSNCNYEWQTAVKERSRGRNCPNVTVNHFKIVHCPGLCPMSFKSEY